MPTFGEPCVVTGCGEPWAQVIGDMDSIAVCANHKRLIWHDAQVRSMYFRPTFYCSARTQAGNQCQGEGRPVEGLPDFIKLCPIHDRKFDDWNSYVRSVESERRWEERQAKEAERRKRSVVYFVERDGFIKIGTTIELKRRLPALSRGGQMPEGMTVGPVTLLATMPGDQSNEGFMHGRFADHRIAGTEWFYPAPELLDLIGGLKSRTPEFARWAGGLRPARALAA